MHDAWWTIPLAALCMAGCPTDDDTMDTTVGDAHTSNVDSGPSDSTGSGTDRATAIGELTGDETAGAQVFAGTCAIMSCHGPGGDDGIAPSLFERVPPLSEAQIVDTVLDGKMGTGMAMPSQAHLTDQQIADVVAYVLATFG